MLLEKEKKNCVYFGILTQENGILKSCHVEFKLPLGDFKLCNLHLDHV